MRCIQPLPIQSNLVNITELDSLLDTIKKYCLKNAYRIHLNDSCIYKGIHPGYKKLLLSRNKQLAWLISGKTVETRIKNAKHNDKFIISKVHKDVWTPIIEYNIVDPVILARDADFILNQNTLNKIES